MEKLFDKFVKFVISFFLLQIHFGIKGSNAVPGNSQPNAKKPASPPSSPKSPEINDWLESNEQHKSQKQSVLIREDSQMILNSQNCIYSNEDNNE